MGFDVKSYARKKRLSQTENSEETKSGFDVKAYGN